MTPEQKQDLVNRIEAHYGGPAEWPTGCRPTDEDGEEIFVTIWNAGIDAALKEIAEVI